MPLFTDSWFLARLSTRDRSRPLQVEGFPQDTATFELATGDLQVSLTVGGSAQIANDPAAQITVVVHGLLHDRSKSAAAQTLLTEYASRGDSVWTKLNGSYVIVVLDQARGEIRVVTDRLNSRKVYWSESDGGWWLSSSLKGHPTAGLEVDPAGVGSVLSSGVAYNGLTVFRGVRTLDRASVHSFTAEGHRSSPYWSYSYTGENANTPRDDLRNDLTHLLRTSVERRAELADGRIYISLSGGHDSRSIAGFLRQAVDDPDRLRSVTYHHGPRIGDTDADPAEQAARLLGISHETRPYYNGDITSLIAANARRGQGMANFCGELDFWEGLGPEIAADEGSVLFVGDHARGSRKRRGDGSTSDTLALADVYPPNVIEWFLDKLERRDAESIRNGWEESFEELEGRVPEELNATLAAETIYMDQHASTKLMLWRECFQMPFAPVMNPYLDNDVLDYWRTLGAAELLEGRSFVTEAMSSPFPELFQLPIAKGGANAPEWAGELLASGSEIRERLLTEPSRLDDLISPETIQSLFDEGRRQLTHGVDSMSARVRRLAKTSPVFRRVVRSVKPRALRAIPNRIPWHQLTIRLLVLRESLSVSDSDSETRRLAG